MPPKTTPAAIAAITAANEAATAARLAFEEAIRESDAARKVFEEKAAAAQKALMEYQSHIVGEVK